MNALLQSAAASEFMDRDVSFLANAECAVGRLIFHCRIPPAVKMNDMGSRREVETGAASLEGKHKKWRPTVALEGIDQFLALADRNSAVEDEAGLAEDSRQVSGQRVSHFTVLGKDEDLLLA